MVGRHIIRNVKLTHIYDQQEAEYIFIFNIHIHNLVVNRLNDYYYKYMSII